MSKIHPPTTVVWWRFPNCPANPEHIESALIHLSIWLSGGFLTDNPACVTDGAPSISVRRMPRNLIASATRHWDGCCESLPDVEKMLPGWGSATKLLIVCSESDGVPTSFTEMKERGFWGAVDHVHGRVACIWERYYKQLIWHETLHMLGATDCYDAGDDGNLLQDRKCHLQNCVMQYEPTPITVGDVPTICPENAGRISFG